MREYQQQTKRPSMVFTFNGIFYVTFFAAQQVIIGLFAFLKYNETQIYGNTDVAFGQAITDQNFDTVQSGQYADYNYPTHLFSYWQILSDVTVWVLVGYGFLMSFLRFHRWMGLGMTFFFMCLTVQVYMLFSTFWLCVYNYNFYKHIFIDLRDIISGLRCSVAILITFGALAGKIDAFQGVNIILFETMFYSLNEMICYNLITMKDVGGGSTIHLFGSGYGLATSMIYTRLTNTSTSRNIKGTPSSITLCFLGTFFLFIFFPAFNCYCQYEMHRAKIASNWYPSDETKNYSLPYNIYNFNGILYNMRFIAIQNTVWALTSSVVCSILFSCLLNSGKIDPEHILNATLSGGVMIANCANLYIFPYPAMIIGAFAALTSVVCYRYAPRLLNALHIYDTRGVFNLHCMPAMFGNIASAITVATFASSPMRYFATSNSRNMYYFIYWQSWYKQGGFQCLGGTTSFFLAFFTGIVQGLILWVWRKYNVPEETFTDHIYFHLIEEDLVQGMHPKFDMDTNYPMIGPFDTLHVMVNAPVYQPQFTH